MNEYTIVDNAIKSLKIGGFTCMPIPQLRDNTYRFEENTLKKVSEEGCHLKWYDTFKGGSWHVLPN